MACKPPAKNPPPMAPVMAAKAAVPAGNEIIFKLLLLDVEPPFIFRDVVVLVMDNGLDNEEVEWDD